MTTVEVRESLEEPRELLDPRGFGAGGIRIAAVTGGAGLAALALAALVASTRPNAVKSFLFAYLTSFVFFLTISLGALFFVLLQHVTRAGWSVVVRRVAEILAGNLVLLAALAVVVVVPALAGSGSLYTWADPAAADAAVRAKAGYLNGSFFAARVAIYFGLWVLAARYYLGRSTAQDATGDASLTTAMERRSAPALVLFALTVTLAAFDLVMSLDAAWYSTIFGVYIFAGSAIAFFAALALAMMGLQAGGRLRLVLTTEHYHDVGKLLFAFVFFWGYIAFSQFMLIWYADIPEETRWYEARFSGGWLVLALTLLFGQLLIPFAGLMSRRAKRRKGVLAFWAVFLLVMHYIDLLWVIGPAAGGGGVPSGAVSFLCLLGIGGLYVAGFFFLGRRRALVPLRDPRLPESLAFENA